MGWIQEGIESHQDNQVTVFTTRDGLPNDVVPALYRGPSGSVWIGTRGGLARFANGKLTAYTDRDGLSNLYVLAIYEDARAWSGSGRPTGSSGWKTAA